ncbi:hypothetical protein ACKWTF_014609 [Chironomus riparius]
MRRPTLFYIPLSPPARTALITAKEIGLDLEVKIVDMFSGEHKSEKYRKINPLAKVPALSDDDVYVWDSHAIAIYLVERYATDDILYPKDILMRTKVNQMLFFEATILFQRLYDTVVPIYQQKRKEPTQENINSVHDAYELLDGFFQEDQKYFCGSHMTIADISIWCTLLSLRFLVPIDEHKYGKLEKWLKLMKTRPTYELNQNGANQHYGFIKACMEGKAFVPAPRTSN